MLKNCQKAILLYFVVVYDVGFLVDYEMKAHFFAQIGLLM